MILNKQPTQYGRLYAPDPRDAAYPMRGARFQAALRTDRHWPTGPVRDQGSNPHCVGYAALHFLESAPIMARRGRVLPTGRELYIGAQRLDEWPGENYDGTSGRGVMKFMQGIGLISGYVWAQRIEDVRDFILTRGPVLVGTEWYSRMSEPITVDNKKSSQDDLYLEPSGEWEGGHETCWVGFSKKRNAFRVLNSWGAGWGENGRAWVAYDVANTLIFQMNGDAVSALEV